MSWPQAWSSLPCTPGVYLFTTLFHQLLYIGKAKNLKNRLTAYRSLASQVGKSRLLVKQISFVRFIAVPTELQALLLEAKLIRLYLPKYNVRLKDDKSPLYLITTEEPLPRVLTVRKSALSHPSAPPRACFGPFATAGVAKRLGSSLRKIFPFCNAPLRQKIRHQPCFYFHLRLCCGICAAVITPRRYLSLIRRLERFLSGDCTGVTTALAAQMRSAARARRFEEAARLRDQLRLLAAYSREMQTASGDDLEIALKGQTQLRALARLVNAPRLKRIECYDISNISGRYATGSLVVFTGGLPAPDQYRRFRIRDLQRPDDPAMIRQVIARRIPHAEWPRPDLIIIDGGQGQVTAARAAINSSAFLTGSRRRLWQKIPLLGLAKKQEILIFNHRRIVLPRSSPGLQLAQALRDQAHRFARRYYRTLHRKSYSLPQNKIS